MLTQRLYAEVEAEVEVEPAMVAVSLDGLPAAGDDVQRGRSETAGELAPV